MTSTVRLTDKHRRDQVRLAITADSQARRLWDATLDIDHLKETQPIWKKTMIDLIARWYDLSAHMAARYLPQHRAAAIGDPDPGVTIGIPRFDRRQAAEDFDWMGATNVLWHLAKGETEQAAWAAARALFLGQFHEAVLTGGRRTIQAWAKKDPRATGWRRVSDGNPCAFCAMLVSRGPVYLSEKTALTADTPSGKYHSHCGCTVEVVYGDWQPTKQEQQWIDDYYRAAEQFSKGEKTWQNVLPVMREEGRFRDSPNIRTPKRHLGSSQKNASRTVGNRAQAPHGWKQRRDPAESRIISMREHLEVSDAEWYRRQEAVGVSHEIDMLYPHEIRFLERFLQEGHRVTWIPKSESGIPTNDFIWEDHDSVHVELKSPASMKYKSIAKRIKDAIEGAMAQHVEKSVFVIDFGDAVTISDKLQYQLSTYNKRHQNATVKELWVGDRRGFRRIPLFE